MIERALLNGVDLYDTYGLILAHKEISPPARKRVTINVPGRDGILDITERLYSATPIYQNRSISLKFICYEDMTDKGADKISDILNAFHEKTVDIVFSDDDDYKYVGDCDVSSCIYANKKLEVTMKFDCKPYKYLISDITQKKL